MVLTVYLRRLFKQFGISLAYTFMLSALVLLPFEQASFGASFPTRPTSGPPRSTPNIQPFPPAASHSSLITNHPTAPSKSSSPSHRDTVAAKNKDGGVSSNAFAFNGSYSYSVDSRTGQLSTGAVVASGLFFKGTQKRNLVLSYNSISGKNRFGLGENWSFNLGYSNRATHKNVVLSNGKSFHMIKNDKGKWVAQYHKLKDVHIKGSPAAGWTFYLLDGLIEHINKRGDESWEEDALGHRLTFKYDNTENYDHLTKMCDNDHHCITLQYRANKINIWSLFPNGKREYTQIVLNRTDDNNTREVVAVSLPDKHRLTTRYHYTNRVNIGTAARAGYLNKIIGPAGGKVSFIWNDSNHQTHLNEHGLSISSVQGVGNTYLPVVTEQIIHPGNHEPSMHMIYRYGLIDSVHNFTGYGLIGVDYVPHQDPLLHNNAASHYTYSTSTDNGQVTVATRYNRFHLPIERTETIDGSRTLISTTSFVYHINLSSSFKDQVANYSLPIEEATTVYNTLNPAAKPVIKTVYMRYNREGLTTFKQDPYGRQIYTTYCPAKGDNDCPKLGIALPFATNPHQILIVPAKIAHQRRPAMVVKTYHYTSIHAYHDSSIISLLPSRINISEQTSNYPVSPLLSHLSVGVGAVLGSSLIPPHAVTSFSVASVLHRTLLPAKPFLTDTFYYQMNPARPDYAQLIASSTHSTSGDVASGALDKESVAVVRHYHFVSGHQNQATLTTDSYQSPNGKLDDVFDVHTGKLSPHAVKTGSATKALYTGKLLSSVDRNHFFKVTYGYNALGQEVKQTITPQDHDFQSRTTITHYKVTPYGSEAIKVNPSGGVAHLFYDGLGRVRYAEVEAVDTKGSYLPGHFLPSFKKSYDALGRVVSVTGYHLIGDKKWSLMRQPPSVLRGSLVKDTTINHYDALSRVIEKVSPTGIQSHSLYEDSNGINIGYTSVKDKGRYVLGPVITLSQVNPTLGKIDLKATLSTNVNARVNSNNHQGKILSWHDEYTQALKNVLTALEHNHYFTTQGTLPGKALAGFVNQTMAAHALYTWQRLIYDGDGRAIKTIRPNQTNTVRYSPFGDVASQKTPMGTTYYTYNILGTVVRLTYQPNNGSHYLVATRHYNGLGLLQRATNVINHTTTKYAYNRDLFLKQTVLNNGTRLGYQYNGIGEIKQQTVNNKVHTQYHYNRANGQLLDTYDNTGTLTFYYGNSGRMTKEQHSHTASASIPVTLSPPKVTINNAYDAYGTLVKHNDPAGNIMTATYDRAGRMIAQSLTDAAGQCYANHPHCVVTRYHYDAFGRMTQEANDLTGITRTLHYGSMGRVTHWKDSKGGRVLLSEQLGYERNGLIYQRSRTEPQKSADYRYDYNSNHQLIGFHCQGRHPPLTGTSLCPRDTHVSMLGLKTAPVIHSINYQYTSLFSLGQAVEKGQLNHQPFISTTTYQHANKQYPTRLTGLLISSPTSPVHKVADQHITYNKLGDITDTGMGQHMTYNATGQETGYQASALGKLVRYGYNGAGVQVTQQNFQWGKALGAPTYDYYTGNQLESRAQLQHGVLVWHSNFGSFSTKNGKLDQIMEVGSKGSVLRLSQPQGKLIADNVYTPYGVEDNLVKSTSPSVSGVIGFDGEFTDSLSGYQLLGSGNSRAFNPNWRQFMGADSLSAFGGAGINPYAFADDNPVMNSDPSGHMSSNEAASIGMGVAGLVAGAAMTIIGIALTVFGVGAALDVGGLGAMASSVGVSASAAMASGISAGISGSLAVASASTGIAGAVEKNPTLLKVASGLGLASIITSLPALAVGGLYAAKAAMAGISCCNLMRLGAMAIVSGGAALGGVSNSAGLAGNQSEWVSIVSNSAFVLMSVGMVVGMGDFLGSINCENSEVDPVTTTTNLWRHDSANVTWKISSMFTTRESATTAPPTLASTFRYLGALLDRNVISGISFDYSPSGVINFILARSALYRTLVARYIASGGKFFYIFPIDLSMGYSVIANAFDSPEAIFVPHSQSVLERSPVYMLTDQGPQAISLTRLVIHESIHALTHLQDPSGALVNTMPGPVVNLTNDVLDEALGRQPRRLIYAISFSKPV